MSIKGFAGVGAGAAGFYVTFHCEHLDRPRSERASVRRRRLGEPTGMSEFRDFQFAGELGAHGFPPADSVCLDLRG